MWGPITRLILTIVFIWVVIGLITAYVTIIPPIGDWALYIVGIVATIYLLLREFGGKTP